MINNGPMAPTTPEVKVVPFPFREGEPDPEGWAGFQFMVGETAIAYMAADDPVASLVWYGEMPTSIWTPERVGEVAQLLIPDHFASLREKKRRETGEPLSYLDVWAEWDFFATVTKGQPMVQLGDTPVDASPRSMVTWQVDKPLGKTVYERALRKRPDSFALVAESADLIDGTRWAGAISFTPAHTMYYADSAADYDAGRERKELVPSEIRIFRRPPWPPAALRLFLKHNSQQEIVAGVDPAELASKIAGVAQYIADIGRPGVTVAG
jgi:hypothetical protein